MNHKIYFRNKNSLQVFYILVIWKKSIIFKTFFFIPNKYESQNIFRNKNSLQVFYILIELLHLDQLDLLYHTKILRSLITASLYYSIIPGFISE